MIRLRSSCFAFLFLFIISISFAQPVHQSLPHSSPEAEGVSCVDIEKFVDASSKSKTEFHSFMLLRHGKVIAEGWWNPYRPDLKHTLYSCSKSFTATAVGFAIDEKKLSLTDKVISFFPEYLPTTVTAYLAQLSVKDVLMMSDGQDPDPSFIVAARDSNWIKGFLATPIIYEPGTRFLYNSLGTYVLSAIVQKVTGQKVIDYLKPRLFTPLGIDGMDWETDTRGINAGGWGLRLKTEDMAKFAQLFLQKGVWNGKQVLPKHWAEEASTMKIMQDPNAPESKKDSSDWLQGYCYQMWRCRNNAFRGDGAFGQYMIVMPDQDAVLAITAETADMQEEINLVWKYLLHAFKEGKLPEDKSGDLRLKKKLNQLALPLLAISKEPTKSNLDGKHFEMDKNKLNIETVHFDYINGVYKMKIEMEEKEYEFSFGSGNWIVSQTNMPGPSLVAGAIENNQMIYPTKVAGSYTWKDPATLQLVLRYIESPHTETFNCHWDNDQLTMEISKSLDYGQKPTVITGH